MLSASLRQQRLAVGHDLDAEHHGSLWMAAKFIASCTSTLLRASRRRRRSTPLRVSPAGAWRTRAHRVRDDVRLRAFLRQMPSGCGLPVATTDTRSAQVGRLGARLDQMLTVVEDQQQASRAQRIDQDFVIPTPRFFMQTEVRRDHLREALRVRQRGQLDEPHAVAERAAAWTTSTATSSARRSLATPPAPRQRHHAGLIGCAAQEADELFDVGLATDELVSRAGRLSIQVSGCACSHASSSTRAT